MYIFNSDSELNSDDIDLFEMLYVLELKEKDMLSEAEFDEIIYGEN
jgi:hypothetical protein